MSLRLAVAAALVGLAIVPVACGGGGQTQQLRSMLAPGHPIVVFPNSLDRATATALFSNPRARVAGIPGGVLTIATFEGTTVSANDLTIDDSGDLGVRGSIRAQGSIAVVSHRGAKTEIAPFTDDPLALLDRTPIYTYRYRSEPASHDRHIGLIAEESPPQLSGTAHDRFDVTNALAVTVAATQRLNVRVLQLERQVAALRAQLRRRSRRQ